MSGGYRLFIGQLVKDVRRRELEDSFGKFGEIVRIDIKNGFGFIEYEHSRDAEDAVKKMDGEVFLGRRIIVEYARGKKRERDDRRDYRRERNTGPERSENRVIVEGLARGTSWQDLKDAFRSTGDILFTDVRRDRYDDYYGIVEFRRKDDIDKAISKMDGAEVNGNKIKVKEDRRRKRSRSRSDKRRKRSRTRSKSPRKEGKSKSPNRRSDSRDKSPKRRDSRDRSPKRRSPSRDDKNSPKRRSPSRDDKNSPKRRSPSRSPRKQSRGRSSEPRSPRNRSRDSKPRENEKGNNQDQVKDEPKDN